LNINAVNLAEKFYANTNASSLPVDSGLL